MRFPAFIRRWWINWRCRHARYEWKIQPDQPGEMADQPVTVIPSMPGPVTCFVYVDGKLTDTYTIDESKQKTIYVNGDTGDDANDGLTWETAKRTFMGAKEAIDRADPIPPPGPPVDFEWNGDEYIAVERKEESGQ